MEHDSTVVAKIVLVVIAPGKVIAEPRQYIIDLHGPDRDVVLQGNIETPTNDESGCIVARSQGASAGECASTRQIAVSIGVSTAT